MKKIISLIIIFVLAITLVFATNTYAASLDTISVDVNSATIRPGENAVVTINFGKQLGAYTFDIAYDNDIFEYVSADGGTTSDLTDKVRVVFHDTTGGTNPRESMSVTFKAKSEITTSNPTEFTVTGEGLANADATESYDDITTPLVKNVTVEPEYKDYELKLDYTGDIIQGQEKDMKLSYSSTMGRYYDKARLIAEATTPEGATVKLVGTDAVTRAEQDIIQSGWGDPQGYKIGGKDVSQVLNVKGLFSAAGDYKITLKLIDRDNSDTVIAEKTFDFTALEKETEQKPTENEPETTPEETPATPEETPATSETKPTTLPKTGVNIYAFISIVLVAIASFGVYYNRKK